MSIPFRFTVQRTRSSAKSVQGGWNFDGIARPIYSLEPPEFYGGMRNIPDFTCIPAGLYPLQKHFWTHGGRTVLELVGVPGRSGILVHPMNQPEDTKGCIGAGYDELDDCLLLSRPAVDAISSLGFAAIDRGDGAEIYVVDIPASASAVG